MTTDSTLLEELEGAVKDAQTLAERSGPTWARLLQDRAAGLRQRIEAIRGVEEQALARAPWLWDRLTGPIPSETAPAAPCETCKGAREVLWMYARGPGDPPGNQMIPCPTCRPAAPKEGTVKP